MVVSMRYIPLDQAWIYIRHEIRSELNYLTFIYGLPKIKLFLWKIIVKWLKCSNSYANEGVRYTVDDIRYMI